MARNSTPASTRGTPRPGPTPSSASKETSRSARKPRGARTAAGESVQPSSPDPLAPSPEAFKAAGRSKKRSRKEDEEDANGDKLENGHVDSGAEHGVQSDPAVNEEIPVGVEGIEGVTLEQQLEAWQESAAEHYEMVEQLPLELHRNFRLLRELDDGCVSQTTKLQEQIRAYIAARLELVKRFAVVAGAIQSGEVDEAMDGDRDEDTGREGGGKGEENDGQGGMEIDAPPNDISTTEITADKEPTADITSSTVPVVERDLTLELEGTTTSAPAVVTSPTLPPPVPDLPPDMGEVVPDGEGGLVVTSATEVNPSDTTAKVSIDPKEGSLDITAASNGETATNDPSQAKVSDPIGEATAPASADPADISRPLVSDQSVDSAAVVPIVPESTDAPSSRVTEDLPAPAADINPDTSDNTGTGSSSGFDLTNLPSRLLPEIGRLSREVVRNCEEKVALAVGAYNSIDRHIRALDSALSAQETSLILGLRTDTLPSAGVDQTLNLAGDHSAIPQAAGTDADEEGGMVLGLGGGAGGRNSKKKKGKKGKKRASEADEEKVPVVAAEPERDPEMENIDPNEPTYCYCNRVSFGTMIACDNEDCTLEWFHLPCTGLQVEPMGHWMCNLCKPKIGLGMGGAGSVQPGVVEKRAGKKKRARLA